MLERFSAKISTIGSVAADDRQSARRILKYWLLDRRVGFGRADCVCTASAPAASFSTFASYMLLVVAPFASTLLALRWFADGHLSRNPQPGSLAPAAGAVSAQSRRNVIRSTDKRDHGLAARRNDAQRADSRRRISRGDAADPG